MKKLLTTAIMIFALISSLQAEELKGHLTKMSITDINGVNYEISGTEEGMKFKGLEDKVIILEFFGHKCPPCIASIPNLIKLQKEYKDKLAIIAIEVQGYTNKKLQEFAKDNKLNYITVAGEKANSFIEYISQRAEWRGSIPFTVGMDTKGDVQFIEVGMVPYPLLEEHVKKLSKKIVAKAKIVTKIETK
ncbi:MAG: TlpA disulfide reductase family protein [Sulfurovum sp.]